LIQDIVDQVSVIQKRNQARKLVHDELLWGDALILQLDIGLSSRENPEKYFCHFGRPAAETANLAAPCVREI